MEMQTIHSLRRIHGIDARANRKGGPIGRFGYRLARAIRRSLASIANEMRCRSAIRELRELDDRLLRDIGLDRSQIESAVRNGAFGHRGASSPEESAERSACKPVRPGGSRSNGSSS